MAPRPKNPVVGREVVVDQRQSGAHVNRRTVVGRVLASDAVGVTIEHRYRGKDLRLFVPARCVCSMTKLGPSQTQLVFTTNKGKKFRARLAALGQFAAVLTRTTRGLDHVLKIPYSAFASLVFSERNHEQP